MVSGRAFLFSPPFHPYRLQMETPRIIESKQEGRDQGTIVLAEQGDKSWQDIVKIHLPRDLKPLRRGPHSMYEETKACAGKVIYPKYFYPGFLECQQWFSSPDNTLSLYFSFSGRKLFKRHKDQAGKDSVTAFTETGFSLQYSLNWVLYNQVFMHMY